MDKLFTFLDLFCGAGGFTLGFERSGFQCVGAVDWDQAAINTHIANIATPAWKQDLSNTLAFEFTTPDVVVGGPPCQGFSSAGTRQKADKRNDLVARFADLVSELRPCAFVFENVEGFLTAAEGHYVFALLRPLIARGYQIQVRKINAANFGVPQHRKRVIIVGGLGWAPSFPAATHTAFGAPGAMLAGKSLPLVPTLAEALADLPSSTLDYPGRPPGHYFRPLDGIELVRAQYLCPGQSMRDLPVELQHQSFTRRALRRVMDGTPTEKRGGAPTGIRRLCADEPSKAITGGARTEFLHPYEHRTLTLRECARLQTFPDDFIFYGTASQQAQLIGNAVPPILAQAIAANIYVDLQRYSSAIKDQAAVPKGRLLSFVPTLSEGVSPVLKQVINAVKAEFALDSSDAQKGLSLWD